MPARTPDDSADEETDGGVEDGEGGGRAEGGQTGSGAEDGEVDDDWSVTLVADETDWAAAVDLRMRVFVDEQGVAEELELDEHDEDPLASGVDHLLVRDAADDAVAVARLRAVDAAAGGGGDDDGGGDGHADADSDADADGDEVDGEGDTDGVETERVAKVERVAVARDRRDEGLGARVMRAAESRARERGLDAVVLHAQTQAAGFYERLGYETDEAVGTFVEDGIEHVRMRRSL